MTQILENVFAVEVPDDGIDFEIYGTIHRPGVSYNRPSVYERQAMEMSAGNYEILFTTKDCTEQQAMKVVAWDMYEDVGVLAANYMDDRTGDKNTCTDSLQSLLRSHGLSTDKNYLLLRKTS